MSAFELVRLGGAVKALGNGKVGGYLVRFSTPSSPDLAGDFFTAETDFDITSGHQSTIYFDHGQDPLFKKLKLGTAVLKMDSVGVFVEGQLDMALPEAQRLYGLAEDKQLGWSSGTASHLVEREREGKARRIVRWPLGLDASMTHTPCEWRNEAVAVKFIRPEQESKGVAEEDLDMWEARIRAEREEYVQMLRLRGFLKSAKNLFGDAVREREEDLAGRAHDIHELTETLASLFWQLQWVALSAAESGIQIDFAARIDEILAGFVGEARAAGLRMCGLGEASTKTAGDASSTNNSYGKLGVSLPLLTHSKAVRDAARGLLVRMQELHEQRQREGKSRTLNDQHTQTAEAIASDLEAAAKAARELTSDVKANESMRRARVEYQRTVARGLGVR
ncbi:MAG TPA: hypothetical protein VGX48_17700 [Pyrinomonadaceae bacterium]|jgi:hypothetical protein|nr:hypothetical protein [Pyrinomonadaceae bacterium]